MTDNRNNDVTFDIMEHIAVLDEIGGREEKWTKEINVVAWNGGKPKIDVRDWNESHERNEPRHHPDRGAGHENDQGSSGQVQIQSQSGACSSGSHERRHGRVAPKRHHL